MVRAFALELGQQLAPPDLLDVLDVTALVTSSRLTVRIRKRAHMLNVRLMMYQSILLSNVRVLLYLVNAFHLYVHFAGERHIKDIHFVCQHNKRGTSSALTVWNDRDISNSCIQINMPPARYTQPPASTSTTLRQVVSVIVQFFRASAKCKKRARTCKRPITQKRIRVRVG